MLPCNVRSTERCVSVNGGTVAVLQPTSFKLETPLKWPPRINLGHPVAPFPTRWLISALKCDLYSRTTGRIEAPQTARPISVPKCSWPISSSQALSSHLANSCSNGHLGFRHGGDAVAATPTTLTGLTVGRQGRPRNNPYAKVNVKLNGQKAEGRDPKPPNPTWKMVGRRQQEIVMQVSSISSTIPSF